MSTNKTTKMSSDIEDIQFKAVNTIEKNKKLIIGAVVALLIIVFGFLGYKYLYQQPNEQKAQDSIATAQQYFAIDSFNLALNGDGAKDGFLKIANKYSSTKAGNLAHHYAGICLLNLNQAKEAINHFEKYSKSNTDVDVANQGLLGVAYLEDGNKDKAMTLFNKVIDANHSLYSPVYLRYASWMSYDAGDLEKAISYELKIKKEYPQSVEMQDVEKQLALYGYQGS